jgi:hypothetical protein
MNTGINNKKVSKNIKKKFTKHKTMLFSSVAIFLSCIFWSKANAYQTLKNSKDNINSNILFEKQQLDFSRSKLKNFNNWIGFFRNTSKLLTSNRKFKKIISNKRIKNVNNLLNKTESCNIEKQSQLGLEDILSKLTETDKFRTKNSKWAIGEIILYRVKLLQINGYFSYFKKNNYSFEKISSDCELIQIKTRKSSETQFTSTLLHICPELNEINTHDSYILIDIPKGFVENDFSKKSGCKLSNNLKSNLKNFGYYSKKNLFGFKKNNNLHIYNIVKKQSSKKKINKKFKLNKFRLIKSRAYKKNIHKIYSTKNKIKINQKNKKIIIFPGNYIASDKNKEIYRKTNLNKNNETIKNKNLTITNLLSSSFGIKHNFLINQLRRKNRTFFFFRKKIKSISIRFNSKRTKSNLNLTNLTLFPSFSFTSSKRKKRLYFRSILLNSNFNFNSYLMNNFKKRFIYNLTGFKKMICFNKKKYFEKIEIKKFQIRPKRIFSNIIYLQNTSSKCFSSIKLCFYCNEKTSNIFISHTKKFIKLNDIVALNFLAQSFSKGIYIPKSLLESYKTYSKSSSFGNHEAQFNLSEMYSLGKGVERNEKVFFNCLKSSSKTDYLPSLFNLMIIMEKGLFSNNDNIRTSTQLEKITKIEFKRKKKSNKIKKKQKTSKSNIFFLNTRKLTEVSIIKALIYSLFVPSHSLLFSFIQEKKNLVSLAIKNYKKICLLYSFSSGLKIGELLLENGQIFLSIEMTKEYCNFNSPWKDLYFYFRTFLGDGFLPDYTLNFMSCYEKSLISFNFFRKFLYSLALIYSFTESFFFYLKFFFTIKI